MNRIDIINGLITKNNYKSYLEIGVQGGDCFRAINCENKVGVDPDPASAATIKETSDMFFSKIRKLARLYDKSVPISYDIIFIDGLHHADQVEKDIFNSIECLNEGGTIVMHDCLPTTKRMQEIPLQEQAEWTGDVWRAFLHNRINNSNLEMCVVNTDWGCGIIRPGKQQLLQLASTKPDVDISYEDFMANKQTWMNIISIEEFKRRYL